MADSTIPNLVAVSVPALTDLLGVRQSGDSRDKKLTVTQLLSLAPGGGDVSKVGTPADDQIGVWTGDGTIEGVAGLTFNGTNIFVAGITLGGAAGTVAIRETTTDTIAFRMSNFDKWRMNATAFFSAASDGAQLAFSGSSLSVPSLLPRSGDTNTGIGSASNDSISIIAGGVAAIRITESGGAATMLFGAKTTGTGANAFGLLNEIASATNPTLLPNRADEDSGIGQNAVDQVSLIGGGVELVRAVEVTGANQFIVSPGGIQNNAALPSLAFGDGDSGFYESFEDTIRLTLSGVARWVFTGDRFVAHIGNGPSLQNEASTGTNPTLIPALGDPSTGIGGITTNLSLIVGGVERIKLNTALSNGNVFTGDWVASNSTGPIIQDEAVTGTNPTLVPHRGDQDTGIGRAAADELSLIAGGVEGLRLTELNSGVIQVPQANVAITAFATGGQGSATQLDESYNVLSVVATTGDSVKLPPVFAIDSLIYIKNDGANAADVFPATGDDLGAGLNTAVSLAAGASASFIATVANATWTPWIVSVGGGGGGDVTKVGTPADNQIGVWTGDGTIEGDDQFLWDGSALTVGFTNAGPQLLNEVASDTNPTIVPTRNDPDTGIGHDAADRFALIAGGVTVAHVLEQTGSPAIVIDPNDAGTGAPELAFGAGADTGLRESANVLTLILGGTSRFGWDANLYVSSVATGAGMKNEAASATNPTFVPNRSDLNSGIGQNAADQLSLIAGGVEMLRLSEGVTDQIFIGPAGSAAAPSLSFLVDPDTGFYSAVPGILAVSVDGTGTFRFVGAQFRGATGGSPSIQNEVASATNPTLLPSQTDLDTGIGWTGTDQLALVAGGLDCMTVRETAAARQIGFYVTAPISLQTGVAVSSAGIHAALVALGLITA